MEFIKLNCLKLALRGKEYRLSMFVCQGLVHRHDVVAVEFTGMF